MGVHRRANLDSVSTRAPVRMAALLLVLAGTPPVAFGTTTTDPTTETHARLVELARFMSSFQTRFGGYPQVPSLADINAPTFHDAIDEWRFDGALCPDPIPELDGWGRVFRYRPTGVAVTRRVPRTRMWRLQTLTFDVAPGFEIRSDGADGLPETNDDLVLSEATLSTFLENAPPLMMYAEWGLAQLWNMIWVAKAIQNYRTTESELPESLSQIQGEPEIEVDLLRYTPSPDGSYTLSHGWRDGTFGTPDDVVFADDVLASLPDAEIPPILEQARDGCGPMSPARTILFYLQKDHPDRMRALALDEGASLPDRLLLVEGLESHPAEFRPFLTSPQLEVRRKAAGLLGTYVVGKARHWEHEWKDEKASFEQLVDTVVTLLHDPDSEVAGYAALFLAVMRPDDVVEMTERAGVGPEAVLDAMEVTGNPQHVEAARKALDNPDWRVRLAAVRTLGTCGGPREALRGIHDPVPLVRGQALHAASKQFRGEETLPKEVIEEATKVAIELWEGQAKPVADFASTWMQRYAQERWQAARFSQPPASRFSPPPESPEPAAATDDAELVAAWDHRAEPPLLAAWQRLWSNTAAEALEGRHAKELSELLRAMVLVGGDDSAGAIADSVERARNEGQPSTSVAPLIRAIGMIGSEVGHNELVGMLHDMIAAPDPSLEEAVLLALRRGGSFDPEPLLDYAMHTTDQRRLGAAFIALRRCHHPQAAAKVRARLEDGPGHPLRWSLIGVLAAVGGPEVSLEFLSGEGPSLIVPYLTDPPHPSLLLILDSPQARRGEVLTALGSIEHPDAAWFLFDLLEEVRYEPAQLLSPRPVFPRVTLRRSPLSSLGYLTTSTAPPPGPAVRAALAHVYHLIHETAASRLATPVPGRDLQLALMLSDLEDAKVRRDLIGLLLGSPFAPVRYAALRTLRDATPPANLSRGIRHLRDADPAPRVRLLAAEVLGVPRGHAAHASPPDPAVVDLASQLGTPDNAIQAASKLGSTWQGSATYPLLNALAELEGDASAASFGPICEAIGQIGDPRSVEPLSAILKEIATGGVTDGGRQLVGAMLQMEDAGAIERGLWSAYQVAREVQPENANGRGPSFADDLLWALIDIQSPRVLDEAKRRIEEDLSGPYPRSEGLGWQDLLDYVTDLEGIGMAVELLDHPAASDDVVRERILATTAKDPAAACGILKLGEKSPWTREWAVISRNPSPDWVPCLERWLAMERGFNHQVVMFLAKLRTERSAEVLASALAGTPFDADEARVPLDPLAPAEPYYDLPNKTYSSILRREFIELLPLTRRWAPWLAAHESPGARLQAAMLLGELPADETCGLAELLLEDSEPLVRYVAITRLQDEALPYLRPRLMAAFSDPSLRVRRAATKRLADLEVQAGRKW